LLVRLAAVEPATLGLEVAPAHLAKYHRAPRRTQRPPFRAL